MGCDIHMRSEKQKEGIWVNADPMIKNSYFGEEVEDGDYIEPEYIAERFYLAGRNYAIFSVLADVRNSHINKIPCISYAKGIPENACIDVKKDIEKWNSDGHSHSYLTRAEIESYVQNMAKSDMEAVLLNQELIYPYVAEGLNELTRKLSKLDSNPNKTRIIFWFDN